jgi:hypothetical protein
MRMKKSYVNAQTSSFERNVAAAQLGATALIGAPGMSALPLPIAALAAASHVAPALVAPFFRRMMLNPRRHVRPPPALSLPPVDQRIDLGDGLVAWRWGEGPVVLLVHGFEGNRAQFAAIVAVLPVFRRP